MILAAAVFTAVLQQAPAAPAVPAEAVQSRIERGVALYWKRRFEAARREFEGAVEADPSSAEAHYYLGYTLYKIAEPTRRLTPEKKLALDHFTRCFDLDPAFVPTWRPR